MELNDIYDENRHLTGRVHKRGTFWKPGEYGLVVCVWVYDGEGKLFMTRRAPQKTFAGTWENSGGAALAGETSLQAVKRELFEETGILAEAEEFELLDTGRDKNMFYDFYCLRKSFAMDQVKLLPGETDDAKWVTFAEVHEMIRAQQICQIIAEQFQRQEPLLLERQTKQI